MTLEEHIETREKFGSRRVNLYIQSMPRGYALMINADETHYYWVCEDGRESCDYWNKWKARRMAILDQVERSLGPDMRISNV